jgi:hypothetical protein
VITSFWAATFPTTPFLSLAHPERKKEGFGCGFDVYPPLEPTLSNKENYEFFLSEVLRAYGTSGDAERGDSVFCVTSKSEGAYIKFMVGKHPIIPYSCEYFLRFSSKVSGRLIVAAEPYIRGVYKIAKIWLGDRVHFGMK